MSTETPTGTTPRVAQPSESTPLPEPAVFVIGEPGLVAGHVILRLLSEGRRVLAALPSEGLRQRVLSSLGTGAEARSRLEFSVSHLDDDGAAALPDGCDTAIVIDSDEPSPRLWDQASALAGQARRVVVLLEESREDERHTQAPAPGPQTVVLRHAPAAGPLLDEPASCGNETLRHIAAGQKHSPRHRVQLVDARDLASAAVRALESDGATGRSFQLASGPAVEASEITGLLRADLGDRVRHLEKTLAGRVWERAQSAVRGRQEEASALDVTDDAAVVLGFTPRPLRETVSDSARSMIRLGVLTPRPARRLTLE